MEKLRAFFAFLKGFAKAFGRSEQTGPGPTIQGEQAANSPRAAAEALIRRLDRERDQPDVRRIYANARDIKNLVDAMIGIMFFASNDDERQFTNADDPLLDALNQKSSLMLHRNVFYVYVEGDYPSSLEREIRPVLYNRLRSLMNNCAPLNAFINERFKSYLIRAGRPEQDFDPSSDAHRMAMRNYFLPCYVSVCRKEFGRGMSDQAFVVGRVPVHDINGILRYEYERRRENQESRDNSLADAQAAARQEDEKAYLAVTVRTHSKNKSRRVYLNAHRFNRAEDLWPQPERALYIGNWRNDWAFSIGAAEHDEVRCDALNDASGRAHLSIKQEGRNHWRCDFIPPAAGSGLPDWFKCYEIKAGLDEDGDGNDVLVKFLPKGSTESPLREFIERQQFTQEIKLAARVLLNDRGQLDALAGMDDAALRRVTDGVGLRSALQVASGFWVVQTESDEIFRLTKRGAVWDKETFTPGAKVDGGGGLSYRWVDGAYLQLPQVRGLIYIYPPDGDAKQYSIALNVDENAEAQKIAYEDPFPRRINPDRTLGTEGVVGIKCSSVDESGRGKYVLRPVRSAVRPFFAFKPVNPNDVKWAAYGKHWLTYDVDRVSGQMIGDMECDEQGRAAFGGRPIEAEEYGYNLICGTSLFELKVSGTPPYGQVTATAVSSPAALAPAPLALPEAAVFEPTEANIGMRLLGTRWGAYRVVEASRSNFAVHCTLTSEGGDRRFVKVYYPGSEASARRETSFYERYRGRAEELYIREPDEMLRLDEGAPPWALVFPRLTPLEEVFPMGEVPTLAQTAAIGFGMASLFEVMAEDHIINFDIDPSTLCFDDTGRLVVVDFDNVYPILSEPPTQEELAALKGILDEGRLPAKNTSLPPEVREFEEGKGLLARREPLRNINERFHIYMLAVVLLTLRKPSERDLSAGGRITVNAAAFARSAEEEGADPRLASELAGLLQLMLSARASDRPSPSEVKSRLEKLVLDFALRDERAAEAVGRLLGEQFAGTR